MLLINLALVEVDALLGTAAATGPGAQHAVLRPAAVAADRAVRPLPRHADPAVDRQTVWPAVREDIEQRRHRTMPDPLNT